MSSPVSRRSKRSSVAGTPARSRTSQQQNGSSPAAVRSTPQQQRTGPNVSMSSPMFFGSSPANATPVNGNATRGPASSIADNESTPRGRGQAAGGKLNHLRILYGTDKSCRIIADQIYVQFQPYASCYNEWPATGRATYEQQWHVCTHAEVFSTGRFRPE